MVTEIKSISCQEKWGCSANNGIRKRCSFIMRILYNKVQSYSPCHRQSGTCRSYLPLQSDYEPSLKTKTYLCDRFITSFCTKDHKTH